MRKLERDMPKFLRAQKNYIRQFDENYKKYGREAALATGMSTEDFLALNEQPEEEYNY